MNILVVDTETGGLDPREHSLLTIGLVVGDLETGVVAEGIEVAVRHRTYRVTPGALAVNGIDIQEHDAAADMSEVAVARIRDFIRSHFPKRHDKQKPTPAGHNYPFDCRFVETLLGDEWRDLVSHCSIDSMALINFLVLSGKLPAEALGLDGALRHFGIRDRAAHAALEDAWDTFRLLLKLREFIR